MNISEIFSNFYFLNLPQRIDRRIRSEDKFFKYCLKVNRFPSKNIRNRLSFRNFETAGRYSHALACRLVIREAKWLKAPAVFIFEDDVEFAPDWQERLAQIELPDDWGMFYLGGQHTIRPKLVGNGLVKVEGLLDTHAWGVKAEFYDTVMAALDGRIHLPYHFKAPADVFLAKLHAQIPTYAVYPNLAWQIEDSSDLAHVKYTNYHPDGSQKWDSAVKGVIGEVYGAKTWACASKSQDVPFYEKRYFLPPDHPLQIAQTPEPIPTFNGNAAFLFLTRGAHHHPEIWLDYFAQAGERVSVYGHAAEREGLSGWLAKAQITEHLPTAWGDISLVRAQLALLKEALKDPANQMFHFLSESCVPIRPWADFCKSLELNGKSRFHWQGQGEVRKHNPQKADRIQKGPRLTYQDWTFHSQWITLNREAAELVAEDDLTELFAGMFAPDECYFGTLLAMKGYPLDKRVLARDTTWTKWPGNVSHPNSYAEVSSELADVLMTSGCFFARKFLPGSNIGSYGLHGASLNLCHSHQQVVLR